MNERIFKLAQQAELAELYDRYVEYCMKNADDDIMDYDTIVKKFAELIVRECTEICDEVQRRFGQYTFTARVCKEEIKEHFGVEE